MYKLNSKNSSPIPIVLPRKYVTTNKTYFIYTTEKVSVLDKVIKQITIKPICHLLLLR